MPRESWTSVVHAPRRRPAPGRRAARRRGRATRAASVAASRRFTASATRCCWAPSWMSRSSRTPLGVLRVDEPLARDPQLLGARGELGQRGARARRGAGRRAAPARPGRRARRTGAPRRRSAARRRAPARRARRAARSPCRTGKPPRPGRRPAPWSDHGTRRPGRGQHRLVADARPRPAPTRRRCPSASTRAIRSGQLLRPGGCRRQRHENRRSTSYGEGWPPWTTRRGAVARGGSAPGRTRARRPPWRAPRAPGSGTPCARRARPRRARPRRTTSATKPTSPPRTSPVDSSSRRVRRRHRSSELIPRVCSLPRRRGREFPEPPGWG